MNVKQLKTQLMGAVIMVIVAAVALSSSTYAWFSMNAEVSATGMQVTAKSNNAYLLISSTKTTAAEIQAAGDIEADLAISETDSKVYPSAPVLSDAEVAYLATGGKTVDAGNITTAGVKVTNAATAAAVTNWYTADALNPTAATINTATVRQLVGFDGYVIHKTVYLTVAAGSNPVNTLTVTPTIAQKASGTDITAAKIVVTTSDGGFAVLDNTQTTAVDIKGDNTDLTDTTVLTVDIYIYYDGNEDVVYTNNAANLTGATIDLEFGASVVSTAS